MAPRTPRTRITSLSPAEVAQFDEWADRWIAIGLRTGAADRPTFEAAVRACYRYTGLTEPRVIVWTTSPVAVALAGPIAAWCLGKKATVNVTAAVDGAVRRAVSGAVRDAVGDAVSGAVTDAVAVAVGDAMAGAVHGAIDGAVNAAVSGAVRDAVGDAVSGAAVTDAVDDAVHGAVTDAVAVAVDAAVSGAVRDAVRDAVSGAVSGAVRDAVDEAVIDAVHGAVTDTAVAVAVDGAVIGAVHDAVDRAVARAVTDAVDGAVDGAVRWAVGGAVGDAVREAISGIVYGAVRGAVGEPVDEAVIDAMRDAVGKTWNRYVGGQFRAGSWWYGGAWASYFREVCHLALPGDLWDRARAYEATMMSACWWWPHREFVIVSERPCWIDREVVDPARPRGWGSHRLHSASRPAIAWPDGWGVSAWHGLRVPSWIIEHPERITVETIHQEPNAEIKRVLLERYGWGRYLQDSGAELVHEDPYGRLLQCAIPGEDEPLVMVQVENPTPEPDGTRRQFLLAVDPECRPLLKDGTRGEPQARTARNAVASTWGLRGDQFQPVQRA